MYLSSFVWVSLCCVAFCSGAKADSVSKYNATWTLSNHQAVNYSLAPGTSVFRGWTLFVNGAVKKGQVYYVKNSPALLSNDQNSGTSYSINEVYANFDGFYWWVEGDSFFYFSTSDCDWVRVYVSYNQYNNTNQTWNSNNTPSSYNVPINLSDIPANYDSTSGKDVLSAINNANKAICAKLEGINNTLNRNYNDLTRPSDSAVSSAGDSLSDTTDVKAATGLFTSIDNLTQGVFNCFSNPGSTELTFPGFGMEIDGVSYNVWDDTTYNLTDIDDKFSGLMSAVRFATTLLVYLALIRYLVNTYHRIFGEGE